MAAWEGGTPVRLRGQQSNGALVAVITLVVIAALVIAAYVLLIAPR